MQCLRPQSHEIWTPQISSGQQELLAQQVRRFSTQKTYSAHVRAVPYETDEHLGAKALKREFEQTAAFTGKKLKADPRVKPQDIRVTYEHLEECTWCRQHAKAREAEHGAPGRAVEIGSSWQLLVDDFVIDTWRNTLRFLNPPVAQQIALKADVGLKTSLRHVDRKAETRFGCPCSVSTTKAGGGSRRTDLYYAVGALAGKVHRYPEWPAGFARSSSSDGVTAWSRGELVSVDGFQQGPTGSFTMTLLPSTTKSGPVWLAGYEGAASKACLAVSRDGSTFFTLPTVPPDGTLRSRKLANETLPAQLRSHSWNRRAPFSNTLVNPLSRSCVDGTPSALGRAADCNVQPVLNTRTGQWYVWFRKDYGTPGGWREIRGVQVVALNASLSLSAAGLQAPRSVPTSLTAAISATSAASISDEMQAIHAPPDSVLASYYFDRLGKVERYRRQVYSVTLTRHTDDLWLGLMTVIEWGKDQSEPEGFDKPAFKRDTTNVYLVTSRDGVHVLDGWVYAHRPLLPKGKMQLQWNAGMQLAADKIVTGPGRSSRVYFESRRSRHENRFDKPGVVGVATWQYKRFVGLRAANASDGPAVLLTKPFAIRGAMAAVELNVDARHDCGPASVGVELLDGASDGTSGGVFEIVLATSERVSGLAKLAHRVRWQSGKNGNGGAVHITSAAKLHRLRFTIEGSARLYAFRVTTVANGESPTP